MVSTHKSIHKKIHFFQWPKHFCSNSHQMESSALKNLRTVMYMLLHGKEKIEDRSIEIDKETLTIALPLAREEEEEKRLPLY